MNTTTTGTTPEKPASDVTTSFGDVKTPLTNPGAPSSDHAQEAKSRFNAALEEAKAGASALKDEAVSRAGSYRDQAKDSGDQWGADARLKATEFAVEGKAKASGALAGFSRLIDENAPKIDEKFGPKYGDYARTASRSIMDTADTLDRKSVDELTADTRAFISEKPGTAVGIAAFVGYVFSRMFRK